MACALDSVCQRYGVAPHQYLEMRAREGAKNFSIDYVVATIAWEEEEKAIAKQRKKDAQEARSQQARAKVNQHATKR